MKNEEICNKLFIYYEPSKIIIKTTNDMHRKKEEQIVVIENENKNMPK